MEGIKFRIIAEKIDNAKKEIKKLLNDCGMDGDVIISLYNLRKKKD